MNEEIKLTENGVVIVKTITPTEESIPEIVEEELLNAYKETIIFALNKRIKHCMDDLQANTERLAKNTKKSVSYKRIDGTFNTFNTPTYEAMIKAVQLAKEDNFDNFTALQWEQLLKALVWVKPNNADKYTFAQLFSYVYDMGVTKSIELFTNNNNENK